MKRFITLLLSALIGLMLVTSVADASRRRGVPDRGTVRIGPVEIGARVHGLNRTTCGCDPIVEPDDANVTEPSIGYVYRVPGDPTPNRDWTWGYIQVSGARSVTLFIVPDDRYNVRSVRVKYANQGVRVLRGSQWTYSRHWDMNGYAVAIGGLNGNRKAQIKIEYEDDTGNPVATRTDCVTIDAQRW